MQICPSCREENPDKARFCLACGSQLAEAAPPQETRKVVTVVFSDLKGSTSLGESLDSEALREVLSRYFDDMSAVLERHGGVVEKFIGDAIMAVFGLPTVHEDDALRAVRLRQRSRRIRRRQRKLRGPWRRRWNTGLPQRSGRSGSGRDRLQQLSHGLLARVGNHGGAGRDPRPAPPGASPW